MYGCACLCACLCYVHEYVSIFCHVITFSFENIMDKDVCCCQAWCTLVILRVLMAETGRIQVPGWLGLDGGCWPGRAQAGAVLYKERISPHTYIFWLCYLRQWKILFFLTKQCTRDLFYIVWEWYIFIIICFR